MHVLRKIDQNEVRMDFLACKPGVYDDEIRALGSKVHYCGTHYRPFRYAGNMLRTLHGEGPFDIVHSHLHFFSGFVLWLAALAHVPSRIAHSHLDDSSLTAAANRPRRAYIGLSRYLVRQYATGGIACSHPAARALFGTSWQLDPRWRVIYCGMDFESFGADVDRASVRTELNLPLDAFVVGHVGRFETQKNHAFFLDVAAEISRLEPSARFLLVGEGSLQQAVLLQAAQLGISDRLIMTGHRPDVPRLMRGAMDVFLFPSSYEGLGLVLIEAQAAGLPCFLSDRIPAEATVVSELTHRLSLDASARSWAHAVLKLPRTNPQGLQHQSLLAVRHSPFELNLAVTRLLEFYREQMSR